MTSAEGVVLTEGQHQYYRIVVVGGGNGGLSVAGRLRRQGVKDIAVVEPRTTHLYKPLFSHVAGGTAPGSMTVRPQGSVMPKGVKWVRDAVTSIEPESRTLMLDGGGRLTYEHVIVAAGIQHDWDAVPGLADAVRAPSGGSHYEIDLAVKTSALLRDLRSGTVIFSQPPGPASCAGAAQKPMYLACDFWQKTGVLSDIHVIMLVPDATIFGIPEIDRELNRKIAAYGIDLRTRAEITAVDAEARTVTVRQGQPQLPEELSYDVLNVEPPQSAPDWLSNLAAPGEDGGFVDVDPQTLRHRRHPNVWALGDAAATANSKSGGALRKQTLALARNLQAVLEGKAPTELYDGYSVCPFTVSRGTVVFAEFDDQYRLKPTIPFWKGLARERRLTWIFDRHILPWVYWHMILKGRA
ncbi:FAD-dependent oxidoreductase [uncultured Microbacterium sp.]|uniref:NAD(P)/FAD-dependent oxidoreductase n=1 Tax=uncultured Microbacterium sp. TaxID=191216 RepID=UPI0028D5D921|nr:FAD-dependent oxidoreductase [uncultured Microbacterium sp.]